MDLQVLETFLHRTHFRINGVLRRLSISTLLSSHLLSILEISCLGAQNKPSGNPLEVQHNNAKNYPVEDTHMDPIEND